MRKFSSYGPITASLHYYVPRTELIEFATQQLLGENFNDGGHYITVWAPRQRGKSWTMQNVLWRLQTDERLDVLKINLEHLKRETDVISIINSIGREIAYLLQIPPIEVKVVEDFYHIFRQETLQKPLILILDEFDALYHEAISTLTSVFRNVYNIRRDSALPTAQKPYLLHGVALIGVRAVLGVENVTGSPFNVQRSINIPNLTYQEMDSMFHWYERESGQTVEQAVIDRVYYEVLGQPGLTSWLGELLTETYPVPVDKSITLDHFEDVYAKALQILPNNNILNIISKAKQEPYKEVVLELFRTKKEVEFSYDDPALNFLYLNGVIEFVQTENANFQTKFANPFVQKRLFNYFARDLYKTMGDLHDPFADLSDTITDTEINIPNLLKRYEVYMAKNRHWLLRNAPRRQDDLRIYEAVYHFNFYMYLHQFLRSYQAQTWPEFPTGNGKIDIIIRYNKQLYGLELKSFANQREYKKALGQAAKYGKSLALAEIWLVMFIEEVTPENRAVYEVTYTDAETGVQVQPRFVQIGIDEQALS